MHSNVWSPGGRVQVKDVDEALEHAMESMELCKSNITTTHPLNPRGVLLGILAESVPPCYPNPDPIWDQKMSFLHPFSDLASKKWCHHYLDWNTNKRSQSDFLICPFLFLSYSFGIKRIHAFIHSSGSLKNHTRLQTKMGKVYTYFQTITAQKPYPMGRHIPIWHRHPPRIESRPNLC